MNPTPFFPALPFLFSWNVLDIRKKIKSMSPVIRLYYSVTHTIHVLSKWFRTPYLTHDPTLPPSFWGNLLEFLNMCNCNPVMITDNTTQNTTNFRAGAIKTYLKFKLKDVKTTELYWFFLMKLWKHRRREACTQESIRTSQSLLEPSPKKRTTRITIRNNTKHIIRCCFQCSCNHRYSETILSCSPFPLIPPPKHRDANDVFAAVIVGSSWLVEWLGLGRERFGAIWGIEEIPSFSGAIDPQVSRRNLVQL